SFLSGIVSSQKEDLTGFFLANHFCQISRAISAIKARHIGISLFEDRMLLARQSQITNHMQTMTTTNCPTWNYRSYYLRHMTDQALHFQYIHAVIAIFSHIALFSSRFLISA